MQGEVDKYKAMILKAIGQQWIIPDTSNKDLSCKLHIRLTPTGMVLNVKLLSSSGDDALDRSAIAAVYKSSPLPVPTDSGAFEQFREFNLTVHPE
jgi:colicin import membrane protein